jgi:uncharacterized membrane protein
MIQAILTSLFFLPKELAVTIIAALPILELRGAIPIGLSMGLEIKRVIFFSIIGNLIPVIPILFLLEPVSAYLRKFWLFKKFFDWLFERTRRRSDLIEKYEFLGLILFVAIPLPITGAWTGCVAATLFKIRLRYALLAIALGVFIAAAIVTAVSLAGKGIFYHVFIPHY